MDVSALLVIIQPTYIAMELLGLSISVVKGIYHNLLKSTCMTESGPVLSIL